MLFNIVVASNAVLGMVLARDLNLSSLKSSNFPTEVLEFFKIFLGLLSGGLTFSFGAEDGISTTFFTVFCSLPIPELSFVSGCRWESFSSSWFLVSLSFLVWMLFTSLSSFSSSLFVALRSFFSLTVFSPNFSAAAICLASASAAACISRAAATFCPKAFSAKARLRKAERLDDSPGICRAKVQASFAPKKSFILSFVRAKLV
mmetsp:Transcript_16879/g.41512  ORF Transcript_16879/g.41512 Transcript_16879/m.41512 type:complete len:203 (+) Transcript_16879:482-1090(+)